VSKLTEEEITELKKRQSTEDVPLDLALKLEAYLNSKIPDELRVPEQKSDIEGLTKQGRFGVCICCNEYQKYRLLVCDSCGKNIGQCCNDHHGKKNCTYNHPGSV